MPPEPPPTSRVTHGFRHGVRVLGMLALVVGAPSAAPAQPTPEVDAVRLALLAWSNGLILGDESSAAALQHEEFSVLGFDEVKMVRDGLVEVRGIDLRHARYERLENGDVRVSPVVLPSSLGVLFSWAVTLRPAWPEWRILSVSTLAPLPAALEEADRPTDRLLHPVRVSLRDAETGERIAARVHVRDRAEAYWPPAGHRTKVPLGWRQDVGGDVHIAGKTWAYVAGEAAFALPEGAYTLEAARWLEYEAATLAFEVPKDGRPGLEVKLSRWVHMAREGWYSGDTHVHFLSPGSALLESQGEDLNVLNVLAIRSGDLFTDVEQFTGAPSFASVPGHVVYYNEEARHGFLGHTVLLGLKRLVHPLSWGGPLESVPGDHDHPPMARLLDETHAQGGHVSWAHLNAQPSGELAIDVALGKVDSVDLMTWGDPFVGRQGGPAPVDLWYRFLNCGFRLPAAAGTDKMHNDQIVGSPRVYAKIDGAFSYASWLAAIRAGRTFATTGPMIELAALGREPGQTIAARQGEAIPVRVRVRSQRPVDHVEIVAGGRVAARRSAEGRLDWSFEARVPVEGSTWLAARAYTPAPLPVQDMEVFGIGGIPYLAHTSPIYVEVDARRTCSPADAAFFLAWCDRTIAWARDEARFRSADQRQEMIRLFEEAKAVYRGRTGR